MIRRYRITGRVQGVGFRWFTREAARELGIRGTVRNREDGSVEVTAAESDALERFLLRLRKGPPGARVEAVEEVPGTNRAGDLPADFRILR